MSGKNTVAFEGGVASLTGGVAVIRKSPRSLYRVRKAATAKRPVPAEFDTRSTPRNGVGSDSSPGIWFRKAVTSPPHGIERVPIRPVGDPSRLLTSTATAAEGSRQSAQ